MSWQTRAAFVTETVQAQVLAGIPLHEALHAAMDMADSLEVAKEASWIPFSRATRRL